MSETNGTPSRILSLDGARTAKTDDQGRKLSHNVTVLEAHQIAVEEQSKVMEFYLAQIPDHVARMIHDALLHYDLIKPVEPVDIPTAGHTAETPDEGAVAQHAEPPAEPAS